MSRKDEQIKFFESDNSDNPKSNGFYMETIKSQKKSFASRVLVPLFVCFLCLVVAASVCVITVVAVMKINSIQTELPFLNLSTQSPAPTASALPTQTQESNNNSASNNQENSETIITYRDVVRIEVLPYEAESTIIEAVEHILPSIAYIRCRQTSEEGTNMSEATALIISDDGFMITADSAIANLCHENSNELKEGSYIEVCVNFDYSDLFFAKVIGRDVVNNIALLKIDTDVILQFIEYGDSDNLLLGQTILAVASGNNSMKGNVTTGIIGGLMYTFHDKTVQANIKIEDDLYLISTTASVTQNNNGGAITNAKGQVIALSTYSELEDNDGLYKAIPINKIKKILENLEIETYHNKQMPNLGIGIASEMVVISFDSEQNQEPIHLQGIRIDYIGYGTPAFYSALKKNDIIVSIGEEPIISVQNFFDIKNQYAPGETIVLTVYRYNEQDEKYMEIPITITQEIAK